jgi:hypothetical protein
MLVEKQKQIDVGSMRCFIHYPIPKLGVGAPNGVRDWTTDHKSS